MQCSRVCTPLPNYLFTSSLSCLQYLPHAHACEHRGRYDSHVQGRGAYCELCQRRNCRWSGSTPWSPGAASFFAFLCFPFLSFVYYLLFHLFSLLFYFLLFYHKRLSFPTPIMPFTLVLLILTRGPFLSSLTSTPYCPCSFFETCNLFYFIHPLFFSPDS